ncbi:MAG: polysaccharide deacetylase family protein [Bacteroidia bacterium]|nr:polysaccharide deacetylase family protein [Bacteroidia bacterium]
MMVHRTPFFLPWFYPSLIWRIPTNAKEIFLTFDDGPVPGPTEFVLDVLKKSEIKATFFSIGENVVMNKEIYQRIMQDGHTIGNHTFNHIKGWNHTDDEYLKNIEKCGHALGFNAQLFRPPYGRIKKSQIPKLSQYKIIMWDVLTSDYSKSISPERCLAGSIASTRPGSIVVFHDSLKAERNLTYALPRYIDHFLTEGYSFKCIPTLKV